MKYRSLIQHTKAQARRLRQVSRQEKKYYHAMLYVLAALRAYFYSSAL